MAQAPADPLAAGAAAMQAGRLDEAINSFLQVVQQQPQNEAAWSYLGAAHLQKGEMDHAVGAFRRASTAAPQSARARYNLGYALQAAGRTEDARRVYEEALQLDPGYAQAQQGLSSLGPAPEAPPAAPAPSAAPAPVPGAPQPAPAPPTPAPTTPVPTAQAPAPGPAPAAPVPAAPAPAAVPPAPIGGAAPTQPPPAPVGAPPIQAPPEPEEEEIPLLAQAGGGGQVPAAQGFELGVQPGPEARPMPGRRPPGPSAGPRRPLPSSQPPAQGRHVMTTVGAGLTAGARIGKGVLAGLIAAIGTGVTAAILWGLVRLVVEAATKGDKADIKGASIAAVTNAMLLIPALLVVGVVIGVIAGATAKPRLPSFLMVLCALGWGAYSFFVVNKGHLASLDRAIVPVVAAVVYVFWFGIAFESQFRARAEDVLGKERGRHGRRVV